METKQIKIIVNPDQLLYVLVDSNAVYQTVCGFGLPDNVVWNIIDIRIVEVPPEFLRTSTGKAIELTVETATDIGWILDKDTIIKHWIEEVDPYEND